MTTLLLFLPPRLRLRAQARAGAGEAAMAAPSREYDWALVNDARGIVSEGRASAANLPRADALIALVAEPDVSWRRLELPRAGRQMRAALAGKLEESLLDEAEALHFALETDARGGDLAWVAVLSRAWLADHLAQLDAAQRFVDRVAPLAWPDAPARGHFFEPGPDETALCWSHPDGLAIVPLEGSLARQLFAPATVEGTQWSALPGVAARAERWLGSPVTVHSAAEHALPVLASTWNLRQFELAPRTRGLRTVRQFSREFMRRPWRPVRWALAGLAAVQLLGLNLVAWQDARLVRERREAVNATLTATFPQVRAILDAPVQMQRELDSLRAAAGSTGDQDLETLLAAAATAWPVERAPVDTFSFELGRLVLSAQGWSDAQIDQFRTQLRSEGWQLESSEGRLTVSRASNRSASSGSASSGSTNAKTVQAPEASITGSTPVPAAPGLAGQGAAR